MQERIFMMNSTQDGVILSLLAGAIGGAISYLHMAYGGFKALPTKMPSHAKEIKKQRIYYFLLRVVLGATSGFIIALWFMDSFEEGGLSRTKLSFISAMAGFSTTVLSSTSKAIRKIISKDVN